LSTKLAESLELYGDYLYRLAYLQLRQEEAAQDIVQETFLAALKDNGEFEGRSSLKTWLVAIMRNKIADYRRRTYREKVADLPADESTTDSDNFNFLGLWRQTVTRWDACPEKLLAQKDFVKIITSCINKLPQRFRDVMLLRASSEKKTDEICNNLGITPTNLGAIIYRTRMQLRDCLNSNWFSAKRDDERRR